MSLQRVRIATGGAAEPVLQRVVREVVAEIYSTQRLGVVDHDVERRSDREILVQILEVRQHEGVIRH